MFKMLVLCGELREMMECVLGMKFWCPHAWTWEMSTILAQASKTRLDVDNISARLVVLEYLAQASISRLSETS